MAMTRQAPTVCNAATVQATRERFARPIEGASHLIPFDLSEGCTELFEDAIVGVDQPFETVLQQPDVAPFLIVLAMHIRLGDQRIDFGL